MLETAWPGEAQPVKAFGLDGQVPVVAQRVHSVAEAAAVVTDAHRGGLAVVPWGGGTHQAGGNMLTRYDVALDLTGLDQILDHQPGDLTLTVQAGATLAAVQAALARHGQFLPFEAEEPERATIGGLLSARIAGPLRAGYGTTRDYTLWTEAIAANGAVVHGGAKVVKNVAGYDMTKLYLGSQGSAGVLVAACFKLLPLPASRPTVLIGFDEPDEAADILAELAAGKLAPSLVTLVHGPAHWGEPYSFAPWVLALGADGPPQTTAWQVERFFELAGPMGIAQASVRLDETSLEVRQALMKPRNMGEVRLAMMILPGQVPLLLTQLAFLPQGAPQAVFAEAFNGIVRATWPAGAKATGEHAWVAAASVVTDLGGRWVLEAVPTAWKRAGLDVWGPESGDRALMRRLKQSLDPTGVLAPGRFTGG